MTFEQKLFNAIRPQRSRVRKHRKGGARRGPANVSAIEWRNDSFLAFLREFGRCRACQSVVLKRMPSPDRGILSPGGNCEPMHGTPNGYGQKGPDAEAIPGCRYHHDEQTEIGWSAYEQKYGFHRAEEVTRWWRAYLEDGPETEESRQPAVRLAMDQGGENVPF